MKFKYFNKFATFYNFHEVVWCTIGHRKTIGSWVCFSRANFGGRTNGRRNCIHRWEFWSELCSNRVRSWNFSLLHKSAHRSAGKLRWGGENAIVRVAFLRPAMLPCSSIFQHRRIIGHVLSAFSSFFFVFLFFPCSRRLLNNFDW